MPDLDQVEALNPERDALWARLEAANFLTDDEKRAAAGYGQKTVAAKFNPYHDELGRFTTADGAVAGGGGSTVVAAAEGPKIVGRAARDFGTRVNTPSARDVKVRLGHITDNHTAEGPGYRTSIRDGGNKTKFPENWSQKDIDKAVREAYSNSREISSPQYNPEGKIRFLEGESGGVTIQMYYNANTQTIESAFPRR